MKRNLTLLSYLMIAAVLVFSSCKEPSLSEEEQAYKDISGTYSITEATPTGFDAITLTGVTIVLDGEEKTYSISDLPQIEAANLNNDGAFKTSGTFTLSGENFNLLSLGTSTQFTIVGLASNTLTLEYDQAYPKTTSGQVAITINAVRQ